ncbi:MAG: TraM recognition domain-containing protein [bacterium]|nr:TraM recognition domain-containing protein [bacterium]
MTAPPAPPPSWHTSRTRPADLLIPVAAAVGALYLTLRYGAFPAPGDVPVLDLIALEDPLAHTVLRVWYYAAPACATLSLGCVIVRYATSLRRAAGRAAAFAADHFAGAATTADRLLSWRLVIAIFLALLVLAWSIRARPFPAPGDVPILDLIAFEDPGFYAVIRTWHLVMPSVMAFMGVMVLTSSHRLWFGSRTRDRRFGRGALPRWPTSPDDDSPALVVGEVHHPTEPREITRPSWLTVPERGLYTGVAIFGAVGTGKTSACMRPFAQQLLSWQSADPQKRAAGLVLEVKGDFCHDIRAVLEEAGRGDDYTELALGGRWQWNPLATALDSYSLAYTVASLLNQLFGKSKEPFWQQAYTNLIRWLIELHRALPDQWVTFRDLYHCAIDPKLIAHKIEQAHALSGPPPASSILIPTTAYVSHDDRLAAYQWQPAGGERVRTSYDQELLDTLASLGIQATVEEDSRPPSEHAQRVAAVARWYQYDWLQLDPKLRTSIVEGVSVFLSMFDLPDVARVFCPPPPQPPAPVPADLPPPPPGATRTAGTGLLQRLPPLQQLIESGRVIALNMPAGANPALARTVGVLLKNAWLQTLLTRPAAIKTNPNRYFRPAVFLCDEYQSFASVGEDDPAGDEKAFALTRQSRVIPIVATQSISSLKSVLSGQDAWRTLLQTLRTKVFLSLSDDASAETASNMCGKVLRLSPSYSFTESAKPGFSVITARAGGAKGTLGTSKSYREQREPLFHPRSFSLLENCQAIVLPYDGTNAQAATRVYLKPHYLPRDRPYWRAREAGQL